MYQKERVMSQLLFSIYDAYLYVSTIKVNSNDSTLSLYVAYFI
jgi:hypothetical protein